MAKPRGNIGEQAKPGKGERFAPLDALRGLFLLLIIAQGLGTRQMLNAQQWGWLTSQWAFSEWSGCSLWDLLQAGMLFVVGAAMPFSYANRQAQGQGWPRQLLHAVIRTGLLLAIGFYLDSYRENRLIIDCRGELQLLVLAYLLAFLMLPLGMPVHGVAVLFLLVGHTSAYAIYDLAGGHDLWSPGQHVGLALDQWLHLAPRQDQLVAFNLLPAAAIVMLGMLTGDLARGGLTSGHKVAIMTVCSFLGILSGWILSGGGGWIDVSWHALIPMIRRIGSLSYVLTSVGWTLLFFTYFFILMEGFSLRAWALPITMVGRNSLILYAMSVLFRDWAMRSAGLIVPATSPWIGALQPLRPWRPMLIEMLVLAIFWSFGVWLYWRRIFIKV